MSRSRRRRRTADRPRNLPENGGALRALGARIDDATARRDGPGTAGAAEVPNGAALAALGAQIDSGRSRRGGRRSHRRRRSKLRITSYVASAVAVLCVGFLGAGYVYGYFKLQADEQPFCSVGNTQVCAKQLPNAPFNVLVIGSDSRGGLPASDDRFFGGPSQVSGQRSDVVKIFHVDPQNGTVSVVSIPRDTVVTLLANQSLYGTENRINVNFENGPQLLVRTIEANFGIPINHVVVVSFGGLVDAVNDVGGVWMDFPYPSIDHYSSLDIPHPGCQHLDGFQALAVARSRHFYYREAGVWQYDGTSDFGRIDRQNQFLRALVDSVKRSELNFSQLASFATDLPKGIQIDNTFGYNQLLSLAWRFHSFNPADLAAYTLPVVGVTSPVLGDVLYVDQPAAQQLLVKVFGQVGTPGGLMRPLHPPPNQDGVVAQPPAVEVATHSSTSTHASGHHRAPSQPLHTEPWYTFNPVACTPR